jgi:FtsP/CotA-like multicopper oxidase with cupredoxin domain
VNGAEVPVVELVDGQRVRARLINASNAGYVALQDGAVPLLALARDAARLPAPARLAAEVLAPGDRLDLLWTPAGLDAALLDHPWTLEGGAALGEPAPLLHLRAAGGAPAAPVGDWPLGPAAPSADPGSADITYVLQGSAHTGVWMINGEVFPEVTIEEIPVGADAIIEVRNLSGTEHPFHLHGMEVEVLSRDGVPPSVRDVQDTVNLGVYEIVRLRVAPPRAGEWMAHCHILPHAHGMMTVLRVTP